MDPIVVILICAIGTLVASTAFEAMSLVEDDSETLREGWVSEKMSEIDTTGKLRIAAATAAVGLGGYVGFFQTGLLWANWLMFIAIIAVMVGYAALAVSWSDRLRELVPALAIILLAYWMLRVVFVNIVAMDANAMWMDSFLWWGTMAGLVIPSVTTMQALWTEANAAAANRNAPKPSALRSFGGLAAVVLVGILALGAVNSAQALDPGSNAQAAGGETTEVIDYGSYTGTAGSCYFYNFDMVGTNEPFNFGPNPCKDGMTAADYKADLKTRSSKDPALLAAISAYTDAIVHTRFMGVFYDQVSGAWDAAINQAKDAWIADAGAFQAAHSAFWSFMDLAEVQLDTNARNCSDLMYMNPYTGAQSPDVIVLKTNQTSGPWLVFMVNIKGNIFEVPFRVPCGYQPSDCQRLMGIQPSETPQPTKVSVPSGGGTSNPGGGTPSTGTPSTGTPGTTPTPPAPEPTPPNPGPNPEPEPTPTPETPPYHKDPADSSAQGPNDDPGPGPDTNNGVGAQQSAKDKPTNSGNMNSYDDYKNAIEQNKTANDKAQQQAQSNNAPSYTPPSSSGSSGGSSSPTVDNNANIGNGGSNVDTPSAPTNQSQSVQGDSNAQQWSGPAD